MRQRTSIILLSFWLAFTAASPVTRADVEHQQDTAAADDAASGNAPTLNGSQKDASARPEAEKFWKDPNANLPSENNALLSALSDPISHRQARQLRGLLDGTTLATWQREMITLRLTLYASDLGDRDRVPAPELSEEARCKFAADHLRGLSDDELHRELTELNTQGEELVAHAGISDERSSTQLTRIASALETLRTEELRRAHPDRLAHRGAPGKPGAKSDKPAQGDEATKGPVKALVKKIPVRSEGDARNVYYVDPERWQNNNTIVIAADYRKPGVDNPGPGIMGAIENSVLSFRERGIEVILVSNQAELERASERVQERLKDNSGLKVVLNAHGMPGSAHFGPELTLDSNNAKQWGERLKGVSEIFLFSCSFGGAEEATRLLAEGAQTHVMSSDRTMYAAIGRGDSPGVQGDSSFVHAYPETDQNGKKVAETDIQNPEFKEVGQLLFDPTGPNEREPRNRIIRPDEQRILPPDSVPPRRPPVPRDNGRDGNDEAGDRAYRSPASASEPSSLSASGSSSGGAGGASISAGAGAGGAFSFAAPSLDLPTPPKDYFMDLSSTGARRERGLPIQFASPVVFAPLLPALRERNAPTPPTDARGGH